MVQILGSEVYSPAAGVKEMTEEMLDDRILRDFSKYTNKDFHNSLGDLLPVKLIDVVIKRSEIDPYKKVNSITKEEPYSNILHFRFRGFAALMRQSLQKAVSM